MGNSYLNRGIICVLVGICFVLAAVFTENAFDGLFWGLAGGALGPGIGMIIMHFYWSSPQNIERYKEKQEQKEIEVHDDQFYNFNITFFVVSTNIVSFTFFAFM